MYILVNRRRDCFGYAQVSCVSGENPRGLGCGKDISPVLGERVGVL
jgi:hypothetical protein